MSSFSAPGSTGTVYGSLMMFDRILITRDYNFMPKLEVLAHFPLVKPI